MTTVSAPLVLPIERLSLGRRALVWLGAMGPLFIWGREAVQTPRDAPLMLMLGAPVLLTLPLSILNHPGAQLVCRGLWWFQLLAGTVAAVGTQSWEPAVIALGAGTAFLAAGTAGLDEGEDTRGSFAPVAFRRSLMVSLIMATAEVHLLSMVATTMLVENSSHRIAIATGSIACALTLALGAVGLYRLRFWGVLVHLLAMMGVATLVANAMPTNLHRAHPVMVWVCTVAIQMLLPMPMVLAILRRSRVRPSSPPTGRLWRGLVIAMMAASVLGALGHKQF